MSVFIGKLKKKCIPLEIRNMLHQPMNIVAFMGKKFHHQSRQRKFLTGFTFVEALIALSIIVIAFINILYLVSFSVGHLREARDFMVGSYLAQEGVELATMYRNENWLKQQAFNTGLAAGSYRMDYSGVFDGASTAPLKFDSQAGYQYALGADTPFVRIITFSQPTANFIRVESQVKWTERGQLRSVTVEDNLYNWFFVSNS